MKPPVIPSALAVVSLVIAATLAVSRHDRETVPHRAVSPVPQKSERKASAAPRIGSESPRADERVSRPSPTATDESASLGEWRQRMEDLLASGETRESAAAVLAEQIDEAFSAWAATEITAASGLSGQERIERLVLAETLIQEGAAAIFEHLEIPGGRRIEVAADAVDALAAEIQYADFAPDHATRLALLRLIRERDRRTHEASAMPDEAARNAALSELENWYGAELGSLSLSQGLAITPMNP